MITAVFQVSKDEVYEEVAKTTSYTGAKMQGDEGAYKRIFTLDADRVMLDRFWTETCDDVTEQFKPFLTSVDSTDPEYKVSLSLSCAWDSNLQGSINTNLFSFFVNSVVAKWFKFGNKPETESYATEALGIMDDIMSKVYYKKKPTRHKPKGNNN